MAEMPKVFTALAGDVEEDSLAPIPFRLEGRLLHPIPATTVPDEVAAELARWDRVKRSRRKEIQEAHELVTTWSVDLEALPIAPSGILDDLMRSVVIDESTGQQKWNAMSLNRFMDGALLDEHTATFQELVRDKNRLLPIETLGRVVSYLSERMTKRP